jgi:hypothetical protein
MLKSKKFIIGLAVIVLGLLTVFCLQCVNTVNGQSGKSVFFERDGEIWQCNNGKIKKFKKFNDANATSNVKFDGHNLYWYSKENADYGYINLINIDDGKSIKVKTEFNVYALMLDGNYIIFSGMNNKDFSYNIIAKDINSGEELCVSNTQNNQLEFVCYNGEVYFFEPNEDNTLYKYNIQSQEKTKLSDLVKNTSSVKTNLCVDDDGIFFTKTNFSEDDEVSNLYKLIVDENKVVTVAENIDDIIGADNGILYCIDNDVNMDSVYKINVRDKSKDILFSYKPITKAYIQDGYLVCESMNLEDEKEDKFFIVDVSTGKIVNEW